jgi:hypothetical protein
VASFTCSELCSLAAQAMTSFSNDRSYVTTVKKDIVAVNTFTVISAPQHFRILKACLKTLGLKYSNSDFAITLSFSTTANRHHPTLEVTSATANTLANIFGQLSNLLL